MNKYKIKLKQFWPFRLLPKTTSRIWLKHSNNSFKVCYKYYFALATYLSIYEINGFTRIDIYYMKKYIQKLIVMWKNEKESVRTCYVHDMYLLHNRNDIHKKQKMMNMQYKNTVLYYYIIGIVSMNVKNNKTDAIYFITKWNKYYYSLLIIINESNI